MTQVTIQGQTSCPSSGAFMAMQILTGAGTYVPTAGTISIDVVCIGAGGGAGGVEGVVALSGASGGGASGAFCRKYITLVAASYAYDVGIRGLGGVAAASGDQGSQTSFGAILVAPGGLGSEGVVADSGVNLITILGGKVGDSATGGDFNSAGISGGTAFNFVTIGAADDYLSGAGGDRPGFGSGGDIHRGGSSNGNEGTGYGGGGGGAVATGVTSRDGGQGADGVIIVTEYS